MHGFGTVIRLALKDYFHDRLLSFCAVLGLAAVLAPLLVLFGVKSGIINTMADRLIEDPRNREASPVGSGRYDATWFAEMAKRREVAFIIPQTRSIAANMILIHRQGADVRSVVVDLMPTGEGDVLMEKWAAVPAGDRDVVLTEPAARKLGVQKGGVITGRIGRSARGVKENASVDLTVADVLPIEGFSREAAFVRLSLLEAAEDYRDGFEARPFGWPGKTRPAAARTHPSFRLYARSIYDVGKLRDMLADQGVDVYTRAEEIGVVQSLDRAFTLIFRLIAGVAVLGYFAAMASNFLATVNRKRRHLGVTRLIGFSTRDIVWFPVVQAIATSLLGAATAAFAYYAAELTINRLFSQYLGVGEYVCRLSPAHLLAAMASTIAMAMLASAYAAYRVARIEPSEVIRDV